MSELQLFGVDVGKGRHYEEIIYSSALIYNVINNQISAYLKQFDLTPGKFNILMVIKHQGGKDGISQVDISKHLIVTASNMTKMLDKLEREEFVTRHALKGDRRVNVIRITHKGSQLLDRAWIGYDKLLKEAMSPLETKKQKQLSRLLQELLEKIK